jgi:hypothetical protein
MVNFLGKEFRIAVTALISACVVLRSFAVTV